MTADSRHANNIDIKKPLAPWFSCISTLRVQVALFPYSVIQPSSLSLALCTGRPHNIDMRLQALLFTYSLSAFTCFLFAPTARSAPSAIVLPSAVQVFNDSEPSPNAADLYKRGRFHEHTLANGWHIPFRLFSLITPALPSLDQLRFFYSNIILRVASHISEGTYR